MQRDLKKASGYYGCGCNTHRYLPVCAEGLKTLCIILATVVHAWMFTDLIFLIAGLLTLIRPIKSPEGEGFV